MREQRRGERKDKQPNLCRKPQSGLSLNPSGSSSSEGAEKLFGNDLIYNAVDVIAYFRKIIVYFIIGNTQNNQVQVFKPLRANPVINCFASIIVLRTVKFNNKSRFCEVFLPKEYLICCTVSYLHTPRQTILFSAFSHFTTFKNLS